MSRRKKEPAYIHREQIAHAASILFMEKGIFATSMNEIAQAAGYSKTTLYVYFENKEAIIALIILDSMKKLHQYIVTALQDFQTTKQRYDAICEGLLQYQTEYPFYFKIAMEEINIDTTTCLPEEKETYLVGEHINAVLLQFIQEGIQAQDLRQDIDILPTIFSFWGMLSGLYSLTKNKEAYIKQVMGLKQHEFLKHGYTMLYKSIENKEKAS